MQPSAVVIVIVIVRTAVNSHYSHLSTKESQKRELSYKIHKENTTLKKSFNMCNLNVEIFILVHIKRAVQSLCPES